MISKLTPEQCRGARAMLNMKREELASAAEVGHSTLFDFESGRRQPHPRTLAAIRSALEAAGVEFIAENGSGTGVRLRKTAGSDVTPAPTFAETIGTALNSMSDKAAAAEGQNTRISAESDGEDPE